MELTTKENLCRLAVARALVDSVMKDMHKESGDEGDPFEWAAETQAKLWNISDDINVVLNEWGFYGE